MASSAKRAAGVLQAAFTYADALAGANGWAVKGSPGRGDWFVMVAPDGTEFLVSVEVRSKPATSSAGAEGGGVLEGAP